jgi:hypothetical protein
LSYNEETIMVRGFCLVIALLCISGAASADNQFRPQRTADEKACGADARRFCKADIPDQFRVGNCLQEHRASLGRRCRAVLESHGM